MLFRSYQSSAQMSNASEMMSQGAGQQAASAEQVSASVQQMSASIEQNNQNARQTEKIAQKALESIREGSEASLRSVSAMKDIAAKKGIDVKGMKKAEIIEALKKG